MLIPALMRDGVKLEGLAAQAGEGGAGVGEGVDADAEPGHPVAPGDTDEAEQKDDDHADRGEMQQDAVVENDDRADENLENEEELALRDQIGLAGLVDQLGDLAHRGVHRKVLELRVDHEPEEKPGRADQQPEHEERSSAHSQEIHGSQVGQDQIGLPAAGMRDGLTRGSGLLPEGEGDDHQARAQGEEHGGKYDAGRRAG